MPSIKTAAETKVIKLKSEKRILIIDENEEDLFVIKTGFKQCRNFKYIFDEFQNSESFLEKVKGKNKELDLDRPDIIVLSVGSDITSATKIIDSVKGNINYKSIPVVVFTEELENDSITDLYNRNANTIMKKPEDFNQFLRLVKKIEHYWFSSSLLPNSKLA